jgi:uncharacterized protein YndB with AHSA1/START domain
MGHEFEVRDEITLEATPEQVWAAIATGPGVDSWFMGRSEIEQREGGKATMDFGGFTAEATITAYEPGRRYATRTEPDSNGAFMAFEYLIEGRDEGSTVLRFVHSGFIGGDDWESEYDALKVGDGMYLRKLAVYVKHFAPRTAAYSLMVHGPQVADSDQVWVEFERLIGGEATPGDPVTIFGEPGIVEFARQRPNFVGVRTDDGLYMLIHGFMDTVVAEYHNYADDSQQQGDSQKLAEERLQSWLAESFH